MLLPTGHNLGSEGALDKDYKRSVEFRWVILFVCCRNLRSRWGTSVQIASPWLFSPRFQPEEGISIFHQSYLDIVFWLTTHVLCTDQTGFSLSLACSGKYHLPVACFFKFLQEKYLEHWIVTPGANLSEGKNIQLIFGGEGYKRSAVAHRCSKDNDHFLLVIFWHLS